jgi:Tol biopolymer transport system component
MKRGLKCLLALMLLTVAVAPTAALAQAPRLHDNGKIAFVSFRDGDPEIYRMKSNGSQTVRLTRNAGPSPELPLLDFWPSWSSDGAEIVFTSFRLAPGPAGINPDVFTMDAGGRILRRITTHPAGDLDPAFSPDKRKIVFVRELPSPDPANAIQDIYIVNADGTGETNLTRSAQNETEPAFSPDGRRIVFEREVGGPAGHEIGNHEIFTMNVDGSDVRRLTTTPEAEQHPSFSPDGSRIVFDTAFHAPPSVRGSIYSMRTDGSDRRTLTASRTDRHGLPSFAPDGTKIVFTASEDIWVMNPDGSDQRRLTGHPAPDIQPSWQPLGDFAGCSRRADNQINGTGAGERIAGTPEPDRIFAGRGNDRVGGGARGDCIDLGSGSDRASGGASNDRIAGGSGNDRISGGARNDRLVGQSGRDRISGGSGRDRFSGGSGRDRIRSRDGRSERVNCGSGRDTVIADRSDRLRGCEVVSRG